jgi:hypothetical protein
VDPALETARRELETTLSEVLTDLEIANAEVRLLPDGSSVHVETAAITAAPRWRLLAQLERSADALQLTLAAVAPESVVVMVRTERCTPEDLHVRTIAMVRDLARARGTAPSSAPDQNCRPCAAVERTRSAGRAALVLNTALIGGYAGYAIQRAGGSNDARLTYPLLALGTGIGIGAGMVVADEWDVSAGDAWYLSAGAVWPTLSALFLATGYDSRPEDARFMIGLGGTVSGVTLATLVLSSGHVG